MCVALKEQESHKNKAKLYKNIYVLKVYICKACQESVWGDRGSPVYSVCKIYIGPTMNLLCR